MRRGWKWALALTAAASSAVGVTWFANDYFAPKDSSNGFCINAWDAPELTPPTDRTPWCSDLWREQMDPMEWHTSGLDVQTWTFNRDGTLGISPEGPAGDCDDTWQRSRSTVTVTICGNTEVFLIAQDGQLLGPRSQYLDPGPRP